MRHSVYGSHERPRLAGDGSRRECIIQLKLTEEYFIAVYNEETNCWNTSYSRPYPTIDRRNVQKWAYVDEIFH